MKKLIAILLCVGLIGFSGNLLLNQKEDYDVVTAASIRIPYNLAVVSKTATSITISWAAISGTYGYNIYYNSVKSNSSLVQPVQYTISGLTANTTYSIQVAATYKGYEGTKSNALSVQTDPAVSSVASSASSQPTSSSVTSSRPVSSAASAGSIASTASSQSVTSSTRTTTTSSSTSSKNSTVQATVSNESGVSSQTVNSGEPDVYTQATVVNESKITTAKSANVFSFTDMSFWLPAGIVLLLLIMIIVLMLLTRKKKDKFF